MKQLNTIERKETKIPQNFMSDTYKLLDALGKMNNSDTIDQNAMMEAINEFTASFVYLKESVNVGQSNIQQLNSKIIKINQLIDAAAEEYPDSSDKKALDILERTMNEIINHLNDMNDNLEAAEVEERESNRIEAIERMYLSTQTELAAANEVMNRTRDDLFNIENSLNTSSDAIRDGIEQVDKKVGLVEKQAGEFKTQCDKVVKVGADWQQAFDDWKEVSTKETKEALTKLTESFDRTQKSIETANTSQVTAIAEKYEKTFEKIENKGESVLDKIDDLVDSAKANLSGEGFRQVFSLIGGGFSIINFILILLMFFMK